MLQRWENEAALSLLGVEVYTYGLFAALGIAAALTVMALLMKKNGLKAGTAALTGVLAILLGFICSHLFYFLLDGQTRGDFWATLFFLVNAGGHSMAGALMGAVLAGALAAKLTGQSALRVLDCLLPGFLFFLCLERLGEGQIPYFGISRPLTEGFLVRTPLVQFVDDTPYLSTFYLESAAALVLGILLCADLGRQKRPGNPSVLFLLLFGAAQVIFESLRFDQHIRISFVGMQQVFSMILLALGVFFAAGRSGKKKLGLIACILVILAAGIGVAIEFAIDRTTVSNYLLYLIFALVLACPVWLGILLRREEE